MSTNEYLLPVRDPETGDIGAAFVARVELERWAECQGWGPIDAVREQVAREIDHLQAGVESNDARVALRAAARIARDEEATA